MHPRPGDNKFSEVAAVPGKVEWKVASGKTPEGEDENYQLRRIYGDS